MRAFEKDGIVITNTTKESKDDDDMQVSANELTKKLYSIVMDVFSKDCSTDDTKVAAIPTPISPGDVRGHIAKRLQEGYKFHGGVCPNCITPLMSYNGRVTCLSCNKVEEEMMKSILQDNEQMVSTSDPIMSSSACDLSEDAAVKGREEYVMKEMSEFNERRAKANLVYTAKLLEGYQILTGKTCTDCDMPMMMRHGDVVECVICPPKVNLVADAASKSGMTKAVEETRPLPIMKPLTQAEIIVQRLRGESVSMDDGLEKAENDLLEIIEGKSFEETVKVYFTKKKADLLTKMKHAEAALQKKKVKVEPRITYMPVAEMLVNEGTMLTDDNSYSYSSEEFAANSVTRSHPYYPTPHPKAPITPTFLQNSTGCNLGSLLAPFKSMFASACDDPMCIAEQMNCAGEQSMMYGTPAPPHIVAKQRIATLLEAGWVLSRHSCPNCDLRLFSLTKQANNLQMHCALCGPITIEYESNDVTNIMVNRLMSGWTIVQGGKCRACEMPIMFHPKTCLTHCPVHGVQQDLNLGKAQAYDINTLQSTLQGSRSDDTLTSTKHQRMKTNLSVEVEGNDVASECYSVPDSAAVLLSLKKKMMLPDPTTSMHSFKKKFSLPDPTTTAHALKERTEPSGLYDRNRSPYGNEPNGQLPQRTTSSKATVIDSEIDSGELSVENIHSYWNTRGKNNPTPKKKLALNNKTGSLSQYYQIANTGNSMRFKHVHPAEP
jgi:uncharacterized Zn finger protein (UPF0148 family)